MHQLVLVVRISYSYIIYFHNINKNIFDTYMRFIHSLTLKISLLTRCLLPAVIIIILASIIVYEITTLLLVCANITKVIYAWFQSSKAYAAHTHYYSKGLFELAY